MDTTSTYELSWNKDDFFSKVSLLRKSHAKERSRLESGDVIATANAYLSLSSVYYSIKGTAMAQAKSIFRPSPSVAIAPVRLVLFAVTWAPLAMLCHFRDLSYSNRGTEMFTKYYRLTANQCDVRQSILRSHGKHAEARECIEMALELKPMAAHTLGLLWVGLGECAIHTNRYSKAVMLTEGYAKQASQIAETLSLSGDEHEQKQAIRIFRGCAKLAGFYDIDEKGDAEEFRSKARKLSEQTGAKDQLAKL